MALSKVATGVIPAVKKKCAEVVAATGVVTHVWGGGSLPDHNNKRCIDFMIGSISDGNEVADYIWRNRSRLGLRLMIWNRRMISTYTSSGGRPAGVWGKYNGGNPHRDHPHVEFDSSPYRAPLGGGAAPTIDAGKSPTPAPQPEGLLMGKIRKYGTNKKRTITNKRWHTLALNNGGAVSIASGPANISATVQVEATIPEGCTLALRFITVNYKKGAKTKVVTTYATAAEQVSTPSGTSNLTVPYLDYIGRAPKGWSRRLRVQVMATGGSVTIHKNWVRVITEKQ